MKRHQIPDRLFLDLARGGGGPESLALLKDAQRSQRLLLLHALRGAGYDRLVDLHDAAPEAVDRVLHYPVVGAWARARLAGTAPDRLPALAAAAALSAGHSCSLTVPRDVEGLVLPSLGRAVLARTGAPTATVTITADRRRVDGIVLPSDLTQESEHWRPLRVLETAHRGTRLRLVLDDLDDDRAPGATAADRLSADEAARWNELLHPAWRMLVDEYPEIAAEIAAALSVLVPMRVAEGHASATFYAAFGGIGTSPPEDPVRFALTLVHEVNHVKLTGLLDIVPLTLPDGDRLFYAPWRDDPRPLSGILQGTYAHAAVAAFWSVRRHRATGSAAANAHREFAHWRAAAAEAAGVLAASGGLTPAGMRFVAAMVERLAGLLAESVPTEAVRAAADAAALHRLRWEARNARPAVAR